MSTAVSRIKRQVKKIREKNNIIEEDGLTLGEKKESRSLEYNILKSIGINDKIVLLLLNALNSEGEYDWNLIATLLGMSKKTFDKSIKRLIDKGIVSKRGRGKKAKYEVIDIEMDGYKLYYTVMELYARMTNKEKLVYIYIVSFGKRQLKDGWYFFSDGYKFYRCSNELIKEDLGLGSDTINNCIKTLEKSGALEVYRVKSNDGSVRRYFVLENNISI